MKRASSGNPFSISSFRGEPNRPTALDNPVRPTVARRLDIDHAANAVAREKCQVQPFCDHLFMVSNIDNDQYSSWPTDSQPLARAGRPDRREYRGSRYSSRRSHAVPSSTPGETPRARTRPSRPTAGIDDLAVLAVGPVEAGLYVRAPVPLFLAIVVKRELARPTVIGVPGRVGDLEEEVALDDRP